VTERAQPDLPFRHRQCRVGFERGKARLSAGAGSGGFQRVSDEARRHSMNKNKIGKWRKR